MSGVPVTFRDESRKAFTLIELLVVIAIIGVLIGLLLPAVQKVREAANRMSCSNNLKQLVLACHAYHDARGFFPPGQYGDYNKPNAYGGPFGNSMSWGWTADILPFIEQGNVYTAGGLETAAINASNATAVKIKTFLCPSDQLSSMTSQVEVSHYLRQSDGPITVGFSNYKGVEGANNCLGGPYVNNGVNPPNIASTTACECWGNGDGMSFPMVWESPNTVARVTDGTSNTFYIGEDIYLPTTVGSGKYGRGYAWAHSVEVNLSCAFPPNLVSLANINTVIGNNPVYWYANGFKSNHSGGLQFAFVDGSVHFISNNIALGTYRALATIRGGEVVSPNF